jgi:serine/threonine protein phosphatase PrpC
MSANFFETSARSAIGLLRQGNEDSGFSSPQLIAVADGMGGHAAGEVASRIAVQVLQRLAPTLASENIDEDSVEDLLMHSLHSIDEEITAVTNEDIEKRGMGTTLTALLIRSNQISLLHVGDSRCYRLRGNTLEQLSNDHTVIQELLDQGAITEAEAAEHPQRSMLTQALRGDGDVTPVLQMYEVKKGDRYLLCSDGLSGVLTDKEIKVGLKKSNKDEAVTFLTDATYINGAPDNVTILIADISETSSSTSELLGAAHD